jgi:hypothetical protein
MKKLALSLITTAVLAMSSRAAIVLNEPFSYEDGSLITVSSGLWATTSGTAGQVDVVSGKVNLSQTETEDVNAPISGGPYSSGILYASFVVNFSTLPIGSGAYFAHFKDATTSGFRGRVWAETTGAAPGQFRLAIANSGSPVAIEKDLSLNTDYLIVMRYDTALAATTLWINPGSESSTGDRADAADSIGALAISTFGLRQSNSEGIMTLDDLKVGTAFTDVVSGGNPNINPPTISNIPDQSIPANTSTPEISFVINDGETAATSLTLSKGSSNTTLVPIGGIVFGGTDTNRTVTITPAAGQQGTTILTVTVTDSDNNTASREFSITVGAPSISSVANQVTPVNTPTPEIAFTVSDAESTASSLNVTATSSNESVVPSANIALVNNGNNRTMTITPAADAAGLATITLSVSDGINTVSNSFQLTVKPALGLDFEDAIDYADGSVVTNSSFVWNTHSASSGDTGQTQVASAKLLLSGAQSEDINRFLVRSPYDTNSGVVLYSKFTLNVSALPTVDGYFAHFRDIGSGFRARVFISTNGATAGSFRLGISNGGNTFDALPTDLNLNTDYTVVTRYNVGTAESFLWVNPSSESSAGVAATDTTFLELVWTYAFRQTFGMGDMAIDDLKVGTSFSDVVTFVPPPPTLTVVKLSGSVQLSWPEADSVGYVLESNNTLDGGSWGTAPEQAVSSNGQNVVTISDASAGNRFFRLRKQ